MTTTLPKQDMNMVKLMDLYDEEHECRAALEELRWPNGVRCLRCNSDKISRIYKRWQYDCDSCHYQFSAITGTIFQDTHLPLPKWFLAIYCMVESKKGISANQMKRMLDVSYKTAWYLCHRIRAAMYEAGAPKLSGTVEADETYVGGKVRGKGKGYVGNKAIVVGVVQRKGEIRLRVVPGNDKVTLQGFVKAHTTPETENIYTDEHPSYKGIGDADTRHETVNHKAEEWVRGDVHTNTVESVWSLLKRSIMGSYHQLSVKHLDAYLDELEWRQNNRANRFLFRDTLTKLIKSGNLSYEELTS